MAWPKGRPRTVRPQPAPPSVPQVSVGAPAASVPTDSQTDEERLLATRRVICAMHVRGRQVPRELRMHDHLSLGRAAKLIRREMAADKAADSDVEQYVAQYVQRV